MPISKLSTSWTSITIVWIAVIFFSSTSTAARWSEFAYSTLFRSTDRGGSGTLHFIAEKSVHVTLFLILAILLWRIIPDASWKIAVILLSGLSIGFCSELLQAFYPHRDPTLRDLLINVGGTMAGVVVCCAPLLLASFRKNQT